MVQRYIFEEECGYAAAPPLIPFGLAMCAPVLFKFGTDAQKRRFLPRIYRGEDFWCQGYSEPGSGSDLASPANGGRPAGRTLRRHGAEDLDDARTHGRLDLLPGAHRRAHSTKKQEGISFLLIDMKTPGITVRPLMLMDGGHEVNEVFFDEVRVPAENLVFEEGKGWTVAKYLLGHERMNTGRIGASKRELGEAQGAGCARNQRRQTAPGGRAFPRPTVAGRDRASRPRDHEPAFPRPAARGRAPGAEVSMLKIKGTEIQQALTELMMQAVGPFAQPFAAEDGADGFDALDAALVATVAARYCNYRKTSIYAGSNEIQRNIIAKRVLDL
mgnify:CR=1 FL=1